MIPLFTHQRAWGGVAEVDPASLPLTLFLERPFTTPTWSGLPSEGTSDLHHVITDAAAPDVGADDSADFDGTESLKGDGYFTDAIFSSTGFYMGVVFKGRTWLPASNVEGNPVLVGASGGNFGLLFSGSEGSGGILDGVTAFIKENPGANFANAINVACGPGDYHFAQMWFDGDKMGLDVDGETVESVSIDPLWIDTYMGAWDLAIGEGYAANRLDGNILAVYGAKEPFDAETRAGLLARAVRVFELQIHPLVRHAYGEFPGPSTTEGWNPRDGAAFVRLGIGRLLYIGGWNFGYERWQTGTTPSTTATTTALSTTVTFASLGAIDAGSHITIDGTDSFHVVISVDAMTNTAVMRDPVSHTVAAANVYIKLDDTTNEVWASDDDGVTWDLILPHVTSPPTSGAGARFKRAHARGVTTYNGVAVVMGSDHYNHSGNDAARGEVWHSNADGTVWTCVASAALNAPAAPPPCHDRVLFMLGKLGETIYMVGGQSEDGYGGDASGKRDMWKSADGGVTWTELFNTATPLPWGNAYPRGMVWNMPELDGKMYVVAGGTYGDEIPGHEYSDYNGVFAFDGTDWEEVLADGHAQFPACHYNTVEAWDGKLWLLSGFRWDLNVESSFTFYSEDGGANWVEFTARQGGPGCHANAALALEDKLLFSPGAQGEHGYHRTIYSISRR